MVAFAFVVLRLSSDPALVILGPDAPPEAIAAFRKAWGLDAPLWQQFLLYMAGLLRGDFGRSLLNGAQVLPLVLERVPATLEIMLLPALLLSIGIGVSAGAFAALKRDTPADRAVMLGAVAGFTVPSFVLGLVLVLIFAVHLGWLPSGGNDGWRSAVLLGHHLELRLGRNPGALHPQRHGRGAGPALYPRRERQGAALARGDPPARFTQCGDPRRDHDRLHGGRAMVPWSSRASSAGRARPAHGQLGRGARRRRRAMHPASRLDHDGVVESTVDLLYGVLDPRLRSGRH